MKRNRYKRQTDHGATIMGAFGTFNLVFWLVAGGWCILEVLR